MMSKTPAISKSSSALTANGGGARLSVPLLLIAGCASASLIFACATPFAAFAVLAAALLPLRHALATTIAVWLANQAIGFVLLGYPYTLNAVAWGFVLGAAALVATVIAAAAFRNLTGLSRFAVYPIALIAAFAVYEIVLLAMVPMLGGGEAFALPIVGRIALTNAVWLVGLVAIVEIARAAGATRHRIAQ